MAERNLKVNTAHKIQYQAPNKETGLEDVAAKIYLPNGTQDLVNFPNLILTELGATGIYEDSFTPDVVGEWLVICSKGDGDAQLAKRYSIGAYDVSEVGSAVNTVDGKVDTVDGKVTTVDGKVDTVDGKVVTVDGKVTTVDGKVDTVDGKCDTIITKVNAIDTPPMIL